jgi:hypothetical protein
MKRAIAIVLTLALAATALVTPGASAQTEQQQAPVVTVYQIVVPQTRGKLLSQGVVVNASCTPGCLLVVKLKLHSGVAKRVGLSNRVVGTATASGPDNTPVSIRARIKKSARAALAGLRGAGKLQIRVTALP